MKLNKHLSTILSILTVILIPFFLYLTRNLLKSSLEKLQEYTPQLMQLQSDLSTKNLTLAETITLQNQVHTIEFATQKALAINYILLPLGIFIIWLITEGISWKLKNKTKLKLFTFYSIPLFIILYLFILQLLNFLSSLLYYTESNIYLLIASGILLLIITYITFISTTLNKTLKQNLLFAKTNLKYLIIPFIFFTLSSTLVLATIIIIYIFLSADYSILIPFIFLILLTLLLIWQKNRLIKKIMRRTGFEPA